MVILTKKLSSEDNESDWMKIIKGITHLAYLMFTHLACGIVIRFCLLVCHDIARSWPFAVVDDIAVAVAIVVVVANACSQDDWQDKKGKGVANYKKWFHFWFTYTW